MLRLKQVLRAAHIKQADMAAAMGIARPTLAALMNHGAWPRSLERDALQAAAVEFLQGCGVSGQALATAFDELPQPCVQDAAEAVSLEVDEQRADGADKDREMLLRKQGLSQAARRHFGLFTDPLSEESVREADDVFLSPDIRYVRESLMAVAKHGGFVAVVGESGSGKSTLRRDFIERVRRDNMQLSVIEPYVLGMEENDTRGKTLKASHIAEAILATVAPLERVCSSPEARFRQVHRVLRDSARSGQRHVLIIEEAHGLPVATLKHLKRFFELEDGFKKLLGIVLIGQSELRSKLSESDPNVREVVQRCELIELQPLDTRLEEYLTHKFARVNKPLTEVVDASGLDAIRARLETRGQRRDAPVVSLLYPLAVGNLLTASMNLAAGLGVPLVTGDVVKGV
jgi:type II secretory pathway predicted ATPase ExeA